VIVTGEELPRLDGQYDLVLIGSGFASTFFLHRYLRQASLRSRVLVLERGSLYEHHAQFENDAAIARESRESYTNRTPEKDWAFRLAVGGGSNWWWACTPRMLPEDFELRTRYGVGADWPVSYGDLEEYYCTAEELMAVSGPADGSPYPRSRPYPLPPHRFTDPDRLLKQQFPDEFFSQPCARPSRTAPSGRPRCCASGVCYHCPIDSKFTILNGLRSLYESDERVTILTNARADALDVSGNRVQGVRFTRSGREHVVRADIVGVGANGLFTPHILLRSGFTDATLGRGLVEQLAVWVDVLLDGVDNFQGSTSITGLGYMLYGGSHRATRAAALLESWNAPELRPERGRWRQRLRLKIVFEDLRQSENFVRVDASDPTRPEVYHPARSAYAEAGLRVLDQSLGPVLTALPVESHSIEEAPLASEAHILGTTVMGTDPSASVVDADLVHHRVRNLLVLGGSVFPTAAPANPTLTICALSLRAAERLFSTAGQGIG
jgi:choline dehydrogenase-like flavoprotein